jgi:hypothetical protein
MFASNLRLVGLPLALVMFASSLFLAGLFADLDLDLDLDLDPEFAV